MMTVTIKARTIELAPDQVLEEGQPPIDCVWHIECNVSDEHGSRSGRETIHGLRSDATDEQLSQAIAAKYTPASAG